MTRLQSPRLIFNPNYKKKIFSSSSLSLCACVCARLSAGGREGDPVFKWEASFVQEAGCALGARTGEGKCRTLLHFHIAKNLTHHIHVGLGERCSRFSCTCITEDVLGKSPVPKR